MRMILLAIIHSNIFFITIVAAANIRSASGRKVEIEPVVAPVVEPVVEVETDEKDIIQNNNNNNNNNNKLLLSYGTQCSFAITGPKLDGCPTDGPNFDPILTKQRQSFYNEYMDGCYKHYNKNDCLNEEITRLEMNQRQPQSMVNMTNTGYMKTKAPKSLLKLLTQFWEQNKDEKDIEEWSEGSIYTVSLSDEVVDCS
jgi:hypothetical protein